MSKAIIVLANGFEEIEFSYPTSILRDAKFDVLTVSITGSLIVEGAHGIQIEADSLWDDSDLLSGDVLVLPGGQPGTDNLCLFNKLGCVVDYYTKNRTVAAICAAPIILGKRGLLQGKKATCYPGYEKQLLGCEYLEESFVIDNNIITARGPGAAQDFALAIVDVVGGHELFLHLKENVLGE